MADHLYRQIAENLRQRIESGDLAPGSALPTEIELRERFDASRNAIRDAIKWLTSLGLVETRTGQGTFVLSKIDPFVTTPSQYPKSGLGGSESTSHPIQVELQVASESVAAGLWVGEGTEVISRHQKRFIDDTPWSMQTSFYPKDFADQGVARLSSVRNIDKGTRFTDRTITATKRICRAEPADLPTVLGLIDDARDWLRLKGTDQWERSRPDEKAHDARVLKGLRAGQTWIVWDRDRAAATITMATRPTRAVWSSCTCDLSERAVYVHQLITARIYAGSGLGVELIDWAGLLGRSEYGAKWIRIDAWTTNTGLHDYFRRLGFRSCGWCADHSYPSGALFQKEVSELSRPNHPQFMWALNSALTRFRE